VERAAEPQKELEWKTDYLFKSSFKLKLFIGQQKAERRRKKSGKQKSVSTHPTPSMLKETNTLISSQLMPISVL